MNGVAPAFEQPQVTTLSAMNPKNQARREKARQRAALQILGAWLTSRAHAELRELRTGEATRGWPPVWNKPPAHLSAYEQLAWLGEKEDRLMELLAVTRRHRKLRRTAQKKRMPFFDYITQRASAVLQQRRQSDESR